MRLRWRGLELPTRVDIDNTIQTETYGKFIIEPFERGFGTTIGNSLRRILLSSLEGAAPVSVRLAGADHEFAQVRGVLEDVTDIILNVKSLVISLEGDEPKKLSVRRQGKGVVKAGDLQGDPALTVHNKEQIIATVNDDSTVFDMELEIRKGRGFVTALENTAEEQIIGMISVDSIYSPVTRVRYKTEDTRVGQKTNYDRLVLEIWTNGTISPEMAMIESAKILRKHVNALLQQIDPGIEIDVPVLEEDNSEPAKFSKDLAGLLQQPLSTLELSVRSSNCLESAKIHTVGDLAKLTEPELLKVRSFGKTSMREIKRRLADRNLSLGMVIPEEEPPVAEKPAEEAPAETEKA